MINTDDWIDYYEAVGYTMYSFMHYGSLKAIYMSNSKGERGELATFFSSFSLARNDAPLQCRFFYTCIYSKYLAPITYCYNVGNRYLYVKSGSKIKIIITNGASCHTPG